MNTITLIPWGGLANRLRAIESGIKLAADCHSKLRIMWFNTSELGCRFDRIFYSSQEDMIEVKEASLSDFFLFSRACKSNFYLPRLFKKVGLKEHYHEVTSADRYSFDYQKWAEKSDVYIMSCYSFYKESKENYYSFFRPLPELQDKIDKIAQTFPPGIIGIHIRRTDHVSAIEKSPTELFIRKMKEESNASFYLATDSLVEKQRIESLFKDRIYYYNCSVKRNSEEGIKDALVDFYLLSKTSKIYGSYGSSFSEIAAKVGNIDYLAIS